MVSFYPSPEIKSRIKRHTGEILKLALPVIVSRTGIFFLAVEDIAILGHHSSQELAYYALGQSPFIVMLVVCIGLLMGTMISTSQALGEDNKEEIGAVWRRSLPYCLLIGCIMAGLSLLGEGYFSLVQQPDDLIAGSAVVMAILGLSLIPNTLFITCSFFLEALKRPMPVLYITLAANAVNILGNSLVVEEYGAAGVAWATVAARIVLGVGLCIYIWYLKDHHSLYIRQKPAGGWWIGGRNQRRHGYAAGLSLGFETSAFAVMSIYAGWLGVDAVGIYGVCMNLMALIFMFGVGVSTSTAIRVGNAHGRRDFKDRTLAGWLGLTLLVLLLIPVTFILTFAPEWVLSFYLSEIRLIEAAVAVVYVIALLIFWDCGQVVVQSMLRATNDKWVPTIISFISYLGLMMPLGYVFTQVIEFGLVGLFYAILLGSIFSFVGLTGRWIMMTKQTRLENGS